MKHTHIALGALVGLLAIAASPRDAAACGGCFAPPEYPTVVTDHRMIFTVAPDQSSLYDQIKYTGNPESFAWVLPFSGEIQVGVSSDNVFSALDGLTRTQILPPPTNCPQRPSDCFSALTAGKSAPAAEDSTGGSVAVLKHEVVGPYETVQLKATDSDALQKWLADHKYNLPDDVRPVVTAYQQEHFNFLALKLVPGQGVQDMRPVRVTTKGSNVALPLRMVAAGTGATVGITLWVIAEGRYHPSNFGVFDIKADELVWDWSKQQSNYTDLRTQRTAAANGRAWEVESSTSTPRAQIRQYFGYYGPFTGAADDPSAPYLPEKDAQGTVTKTAQQVEEEDFEALFHGIPDGAERVTRMRADLAHASLDQDLVVAAAADQAQLQTQRQVVKELGEPNCPVYNGCEQEGTAPRSQAISRTNDNNSGCKIVQREGSRESWLVIALGFAGLSLGRKHRRQKKKNP